VRHDRHRTAGYLTNYSRRSSGIVGETAFAFSSSKRAAVIGCSPPRRCREIRQRQLAIALYVVFILTSSIPILLRLIGSFRRTARSGCCRCCSATFIPIRGDCRADHVLSMLTDVVEDNEVNPSEVGRAYFAAMRS